MQPAFVIEGFFRLCFVFKVAFKDTRAAETELASRERLIRGQIVHFRDINEFDFISNIDTWLAFKY